MHLHVRTEYRLHYLTSSWWSIDVDTWWTKRWVAFDPHSIDLDARTLLNFMSINMWGLNPPPHTIVHLKRFATTLAGRVQYRNIKRMVFEELVSRHHEKVKNLQHAACSFYIYIYDDQLYMNIALFLQVRMTATKLQSNNIDVGLVLHTHDLYV